MDADSVVKEHVCVYRSLGLGAGIKVQSIQTLHLEGLEKGFGAGVVVRISWSAQGVLQISCKWDTF